MKEMEQRHKEEIERLKVDHLKMLEALRKKLTLEKERALEELERKKN